MRFYGHYVRYIAYLALENYFKAFQDYWHAYILAYEGSFSIKPRDMDELYQRVFAGYGRSMTAEEMVPGMIINRDTGSVF